MGFAFAGLAYAVRTQRNMRIHLFLAFFAFAFALFLQLSSVYLLFLSLTVTLVLAAEMFNTALEAAVDLHGTTFRPLAKVAKDVSATAVLLTAANAIVTAVVLFGPRLSGVANLAVDALRAFPAALIGAAVAVVLKSVGHLSPAPGVAASFAFATWLFAVERLPGPAGSLLVAGLVLACGRTVFSRFAVRSFLGGMAVGVLTGLVAAYLMSGGAVL